jgi:hypothetical protein
VVWVVTYFSIAVCSAVTWSTCIDILPEIIVDLAI